jgi:hypothetical protein
MHCSKLLSSLWYSTNTNTPTSRLITSLSRTRWKISSSTTPFKLGTSLTPTSRRSSTSRVFPRPTRLISSTPSSPSRARGATFPQLHSCPRWICIHPRPPCFLAPALPLRLVRDQAQITLVHSAFSAVPLRERSAWLSELRWGRPHSAGRTHQMVTGKARSGRCSQT